MGMPGPCHFVLEIDHVRASGGLGMKSETTIENLISMCRIHHETKTLNGRIWRPRLLEYLAAYERGEEVVGRL